MNLHNNQRVLRANRGHGARLGDTQEFDEVLGHSCEERPLEMEYNGLHDELVEWHVTDDALALGSEHFEQRAYIGSVVRGFGNTAYTSPVPVYILSFLEILELDAAGVVLCFEMRSHARFHNCTGFLAGLDFHPHELVQVLGGKHKELAR